MVWSPGRVFVSLSLVFGAALGLVTPPAQGPDESDHFSRAFQIAEGVFLPTMRPHLVGEPDRLGSDTGGELPRSLAATFIVFEPVMLRPGRTLTFSSLREGFRILLAPERRRFIGFGNTAVTSPLPYVPQALAIAVARSLSEAVLVHSYAGRLANLLVSTLLVALAIRVTPILKWGFVVLALTPMALFQSSSLSSDSLTNATSFLLSATILRCALGSSGHAGKHLLGLLVVLSIGMGLIKQMYLPLLLATWMIPEERLGGPRRRLAFFGLLLLATAAGTASWALISRRILSTIEPGVDFQSQMTALFADPLAFPMLIARTLATDGGYVLRTYLGVLGTLDTELPGPLLWSFALVLLLVAVTDFEAGIRLDRARRLLALSAASLTFLSVCLSIHLVGGLVGDEVIYLQGRYFIPLGPLVLLALYGRGRRVTGVARWVQAHMPILVAAYLCGALALTTVTVAQRYFRFGQPRAAYYEFVALDAGFREAGQFDDVARTFAALLTTPAARAVAHYSRAAELDEQERTDQAIVEYREVLRLRPDAPLVPRHLARLLVRRKDPSEGDAADAESLARRACAASRFEDPLELEVLATALAARHRYLQAIRVQELAIQRAHQTGNSALVRQLSAGLEQYRRASRGTL